MTVVVSDSPAPPAPPAPLRPAVWLSVLVDVLLAGAVCAVIGTQPFLGAVWTLAPQGWDWHLPFVVAAQIASLAALQAYARRARIDWLLRVVAGVIAGTAIGGVVVTVLAGSDSVPGGYLLIAGLLTVAALAWRIAWVLVARRARAHAQVGDQSMADRSVEMTTLSGVVSSLYGYRELLKNLVLKDVKLKYRGSVFGFLWSLANPLLMIVVYAVAFTYIIPIRSTGFVFYLMLGQLAWTFFASSAAMSTGAIVDNSALLKSVLFPRAILPMSTVLFNLVQFVLTLAVFLPVMMLWYRVPLVWPMALFPVFLMLQLLFTIGIALLLATATAFFRDVRHLLEVGLSVLFWTTPILYELSHVPERFQPLVLLSPAASFVVAYEQMFFFRIWPEPMVWLVASGYAVGTFVVGVLVFLAFEDRFTEQL